MDAKEKLGQYKEQVEVELQKYLDNKTQEAGEISPYCQEIMEHITDITMRGGKRIRAALLYYSFLAHGGENKAAAIQASLAMELMQTFLLIHDDIIDNDSLRRGGKTIHTIYKEIGAERFPGKIDPEQFGKSVAILAGDTANGFSNEIIAELNQLGIDKGYASRALLELNKMYNKEYYGEFLDVISELTNDFKQKDLIQVHQLKTVPYTFDGPIKIGAILAGASEEDLQKLEGYTVPLGTAFQIQDDVLGTFGTEEKIGKPVTSDLREGKRTLLILDALDKANEEQKEIIEKNLGNKLVGMEELEEVRQVIKETGAYQESIDAAHKYVNESIKSLDSTELKKEGKDFLIGIAEYMVDRDF